MLAKNYYLLSINRPILLNVIPIYFLLSISYISNLYDICSSTLYVISYVYHSFWMSSIWFIFSNFQTANLFYIKRSFYSVLTSLKLSRAFAWFSIYKKALIKFSVLNYVLTQRTMRSIVQKPRAKRVRLKLK